MRKFERLLVGSFEFIIVVMMVAGCAHSRSITLGGKVTYDDNGDPASGKEVVFTQLHGLWFEDPKALGTSIVDASGRYKIEIKMVKGTVDIRINAEKCDNNGAVIQLDVETFKPDGVASVDLSLKRDVCVRE